MAKETKQQQATSVLDPATDERKAALAVPTEDEGAGFEGMSQDDLAIPFLTILQSNSPQIDESSTQYVTGAKAGMLFNTVTKDLYDGKDKGVRFIPVHRVHKYNEWAPDRGGFRGTYAPEDPFVVAAKRYGPRFGKLVLNETSGKDHEGNELVETFEVYGLLVADGEDDLGEPVVLAFSSTQIKHYKKWMTMARSIVGRNEQGQRVRPPLFATPYRLRSVGQENKKGKWYGWNIRVDGPSAEAARLPQSDPIYQAAKNIRDLILSGAASAATGSMSADANEGDEAEGVPVAPAGDTSGKF